MNFSEIIVMLIAECSWLFRHGLNNRNPLVIQMLQETFDIRGDINGSLSINECVRTNASCKSNRISLTTAMKIWIYIYITYITNIYWIGIFQYIPIFPLYYGALSICFNGRPVADIANPECVSPGSVAYVLPLTMWIWSHPMNGMGGYKSNLWYFFLGISTCFTWWRYQMETFSALLAICAEKSPVPGEFPTQRPVTRSFHIFFDLRPIKPLSKQSWGWWFETPSRPLWRHCNDISYSSGFRHWHWRNRSIFPVPWSGPIRYA